MTKQSNHILEINNLNVEFPIFGGIIQREVSCVHAVKDFNLNIVDSNPFSERSRIPQWA